MSNSERDETSKSRSEIYRDREQYRGRDEIGGTARTTTEIPGKGEQNPRPASVPPPPDEDDPIVV